MLVAALLILTQPVGSARTEEERRAGLEIIDRAASNGQMVRLYSTVVPSEQLYESIPTRGQDDYLKDPKVMRAGGWSGYALFEIHKRDKVTPMVTVSLLHFSKSPGILSELRVFGREVPTLAARFSDSTISGVACLSKNRCPRANMVEFALQPEQFRRLVSERSGVPISFRSTEFGVIKITLPQKSVDAVLEVAGAATE